MKAKHTETTRSTTEWNGGGFELPVITQRVSESVRADVSVARRVPAFAVTAERHLRSLLLNGTDCGNECHNAVNLLR